MFGATLPSLSKFLSKGAAKRLPLTTKRAGKGFMKGKGGTIEGTHTSKGRYRLDPFKQLEIVAPSPVFLEAFKLKPYLATSVSKFKPAKEFNPSL